MESIIRTIAGIYPRIDGPSYQLGIIDSFCEMVAAGVKRLALSHPLEKREYSELEAAVGVIAGRYGVSFKLEDAFPITDLSPPGSMAGKVVVLFFTDPRTQDEYERLAEAARELARKGEYDAAARKVATLRLCDLLGYPQARLRSLYPED